MAHMVETMAYVGEVPWHGLGTNVPDGINVEEMLKVAGLDWRVNREPLFTAGPELDNGSHEYQAMDSHFALRRDSDQSILGICGKDYTPIQNHEAFTVFNQFVEAGHMKMETAGSLRGGRDVWGLARINAGFELAGGDEVKGYLLLSKPHEWGRALRVFFTPIRVVCNNTLTYAMTTRGDDARVSHIQQFTADTVARINEALGVSPELMVRYKEQAEFLAQKRAKTFDVQKWLGEIFDPKALESVKALEDAGKETNVIDFGSTNAKLAEEAIYTSPGFDLPSARGTWWGAFNGVTFMVDHMSGRTNDNRLEQAWFGSKAALKRKALTKALEYANAA